MARRRKMLTLNAERRKKTDQIEARRQANRIAQQTRRANLRTRIRDQERNTAAHQAKRQTTVRAKEQAKNNAARRLTRQVPTVKATEQAQSTRACQVKRQEQTKSKKAVADYEQQIQDVPMHHCYSCDRLCFIRTSPEPNKGNMLESRTNEEENAGAHAVDSEFPSYVAVSASGLTNSSGSTQPERNESSSGTKEVEDDLFGYKGKAPNNLLMKFLTAVTEKDFQTASKLCKMILIYEPDNKEALLFAPLIEEKIKLDEEADLDETEDDEEEEGDSVEDNDEDEGDEHDGEQEGSESDEGLDIVSLLAQP